LEILKCRCDPREQMRQAEDPLYAGILSCIRLRVPTDDNIEVLRRRIGA
jgi:hypothetical protein